MNGKNSEPPRGAVWLLERLGPASGNEGLTGDLIEKFHEGRSSGWFWKQVLIAIAVGYLSGIGRNWPAVCYGLALAFLAITFGKSFMTAPRILRWWRLPYPWSTFVLDWSPGAFLSLSSLTVLAGALLINRTFRWISLARTWMINVALSVLYHSLLAATASPIPGSPTGNRAVRVPFAIGVLILFLIPFVSAWLGCRRPIARGTPLRDRRGSVLPWQ